MKTELFIDGAWRPATGGATFAVIDPSAEAPFAEAARGTAEDVDLAVKAARRAFDDGPWPRMSGRERAAIVRAVGRLIAERKEELAALEVRDNGKPLPEALWDIGDAAYCFEYYADMAEAAEAAGPMPIPLGDTRFTSKVVHEPLGVVGAIVPWNYPLLMAAWKVAPALAAGCTIVLKPSELTPMTAVELARITEAAGLPKGVFNLVTGYGAEAGAPLAGHPGVDKVAFTGSVPTGSKVMQAAAADIKAISLELGGKSPFVVFADSDIEKAVEWIMFGIFWNQGQVCSATSRILVERPLYAPLLERLAAEAAKITIGGGMEAGVLLGPIVSEGQYAKVLGAIERGKAEGARLVWGGKRPAGRDTGYFVEPTVFAEVPLSSWVWREEIFGPVVCVNPFDTEEEAVRLANDSPYGLAGAVMSDDLDRCERVAAALRAGIVWINCSQPTFTEAPWGGYKRSGIGRELGRWGFDAYRQVKQVTAFDRTQKWGWYLK
ncbi:MAG TPA: aldehyde dehydrogenase family protein [Rhizobiales bacterium]|nr:aldehyde dehydrogenase family protein [Hyphomicrobiales bacterium]